MNILKHPARLASCGLAAALLVAVPTAASAHEPGDATGGLVFVQTAEATGNTVLEYRRTPAGGLVTVRVVEDPFGQVVVLQVEDSGPGIAPAEREKVFQPFYRSLGSGVEGSGLGLAIVREIVQQHDADLMLDDTRVRRVAGGESPDGQGPGARFTIRFRALAEDVRSSPAS